MTKLCTGLGAFAVGFFAFVTFAVMADVGAESLALAAAPPAAIAAA
jgi:hypothetical protein